MTRTRAQWSPGEWESRAEVGPFRLDAVVTEENEGRWWIAGPTGPIDAGRKMKPKGMRDRTWLREMKLRSEAALTRYLLRMAKTLR